MFLILRLQLGAELPVFFSLRTFKSENQLLEERVASLEPGLYLAFESAKGISDCKNFNARKNPANCINATKEKQNTKQYFRPMITKYGK